MVYTWSLFVIPSPDAEDNGNDYRHRREDHADYDLIFDSEAATAAIVIATSSGRITARAAG
jgi:hypothetical protein